MANDADTTVAPKKNKKESNNDHNSSLTTKCSVCHHQFKTLQECLKHELLSHSLRKAKKPVDSRLKTANKFLNSMEKRQERINVHNALQKCEVGNEFGAIFKVLCFDRESLQLIFTRIEACIAEELLPLGTVQIFPFGSIASGLALRDSDIDIYMDASAIPTHEMVQSPNRRKAMMQGELPARTAQYRGSFNRINYALQRSSRFTDVYPIRRARVPIIKCKHCDTGFSIDINVCCRSSLHNTHFISELVVSDPRIRALFLFIKLWAKNMQIIGKANMTSYCLITMVIFYLQQPYKLQVPVRGRSEQQILKSVMELQDNCNPKYTEGINYAFDLQSPANRPRVPRSASTRDLLKGFFRFYKEFNFDEFIISPFLGKAIPKTDFTVEKFKLYRDQLANITHYMDEIPAPTFAMDRSMCVQDSFALNHNVAQSIILPSRQFFMVCLENANKICQDMKKSTCGEILEKLLYETAPNAGDALMDAIQILEKTENVDVDLNTARKGLNYFMEPSKADLNCIAKTQTHLNNPTAMLRLWCDHYVEAIPRLITDLYHIDFQTHIETAQKQQRLDNNNLSHIWQISSSVDLWSNRFFQKSTQSFYDYQMEQTRRLHSLRRQDAAFCIELKALLTISIVSGYAGLNVAVRLPDGSSDVNKKNPLKKFFNALKNTLQNFTYKELLLIGEKRKSGETAEKTVDEKKKNGPFGFG